MPRKKTAETKVVEAEHVIKYSAPVSVPAEEIEQTEDAEMIFDDEAEIEDRPKRKPKNEREELRKKLQANGVTAASPLKLIIERYLHSDASDSGTMAEKEYCTKYATNEAHITNQDYLDVASKWGPGRYWFTLYLNSKIVTQWERRLGIASFPSPQFNVQPTVNGDASSPHVVVQMPNNSQQPVAVADPMKQLKEMLQMQKLMRDALGDMSQQQQQSQHNESPADAIFNHPKVIDTLVDTMVSVAKKAAGLRSGHSDGDTWPSAIKELGIEALKSGQAPEILGALIRELVAPFKSAIMGGQNGTSQMASQAVSQISRPDHQWSQPGQDNQAQSQQEGAQGKDALRRSGLAGTGEGVGNDPQPAITPEEQVLALALDHCARQIPPQIAAQRIVAIADAINEQAPGMSIDGYLLLFTQLEPKAALQMAIHLTPTAGDVVALPHAAQWTAELQALLKAQIGEEYAESSNAE